MHNLRHHNEVLQENQPVLVLKEVVQRKVHKQPQIKLYVKHSQLLPQRLRVLNVPHMMTPPDEEQHLHVENDKQYQVSK